MSIADLLRSLVDGEMRSLTILGASPLAIGGFAWVLARLGHRRTSQAVANLGIGLGVGAVITLLAALWWLSQVGTNVVTGVPTPWLLVPLWMLAAAVVIERRLHPGRQEAIRARIRGAVVLLAVVGLLYWLLSEMHVWMLVRTGVLGLLFFLAALVLFGWFLIRRVF